MSTRPVRVSTTVEPSGIKGAPVAGSTIAREGPVTSSFATSSGSTRGAEGNGSTGEAIEGNGWIAAREGDFAGSGVAPGALSSFPSSLRAASRCSGVACFEWISPCSSRIRAT